MLIVLVIVAVVAAVLAGWLPLRSADARRQSAAPSAEKCALADGTIATLRKAPLMSSIESEPVAYLSEVAEWLYTGCQFFFSGRALHSYLIRIPTWSRMSHVGKIIHSAVARKILEKLGQPIPQPMPRWWVAESIEGLKLRRKGWRIWLDKGGFNIRPLDDYVRKYPGQCYVARIAPQYEAHYNTKLCGDVITSSRNWKYGYLGILFQVLSKGMFIRIPTYLLTWKYINRSWGGNHGRFCSWATSTWDTLSCTDPVPNLAPQLTSPAEIERSKLFGQIVALQPDRQGNQI